MRLELPMLTDEELKAVFASSHRSVTNGPLSEADVRRVEARIGGKLPSDYLALLRVQNGGLVAKRYRENVNGEVAQIRGIGLQAPRNIESHDWAETLSSMAEEGITEPAGLRRMVPFSGGGHYYVCFDYNRVVDGEPTIAFVDVELFGPAVLVATTFEAFIRGLRAD